MHKVLDNQGIKLTKENINLNKNSILLTKPGERLVLFQQKNVSFLKQTSCLGGVHSP